MGVNLKDITISHPITIKELAGKTLAVDSFNLLYQFITTIRGPDGTPLQDQHGNVTSHLQGLFSRTTSLLASGLRFIFVFDGQPPALKNKELEHRAKIKKDAQVAFDKAKLEGDIISMRKYASRVSRLTPDLVEEAKSLIAALGQPIVEAPSEGEAQVASIVKEKNAYAAVSQDYDSLLYETPVLVRNLSIVGRRKLPGRATWRPENPEMLLFKENIVHLGISPDQLLCLSILVGTDYNPGGIKGIGPKKALELVKTHPSPKQAFSSVSFNQKSEVPWEDVWNTFRNMPVIGTPHLRWNPVNEAQITKLLVDEHDFSPDRIAAQLTNLLAHTKGRSQTALSDF